LKGKTSQAPKPAPYRPGLDRPTLINTGGGATARDDETGRERILANLEGRSARTGTTARGRKRMAMWSFGLVGIGVAVAASYWYVVSSSLPTVQTAAVQNADAAKPVHVTAAGSEAPPMAGGAVTVAANAPTAAGAMVAPTAVIENMTPPAANANAAAAPVAAPSAPVPVPAKSETTTEPKKPTAVAPAKPSAAHAKASTKGGKNAGKAVVATSGDGKPAKRAGQADNDVDLIEALIVHTMQSNSDGKTTK
jgi:hypothetical protein